jgi:MarR family transcriptional regulator, lower aerobic nicotinate degradation pathway regulator
MGQPSNTIHVDQMPGHAVRRLHQISVGIAHQEAQDLGITPVQYAILQSVHNQPNTDQRTLANTVSLDTSTTAGVVDRLEARGLLTRNASPDDRRVRLLMLTLAGEALLDEAIPRMEKVQELILAPLTPRQRKDFMVLLNTLVSTNNELSRAHSDAKKLV